MAPEEALAEILQVPLGCVTPFALVNESARHVSLLLDQGFKTQERCFFHPLSNDMSIALNARDLDKFLNSIGKTPAYVDLEANPPVGKDQPPDLANFVPSDATALPDPQGKQGSSQVSPKYPMPVDNKPTVNTVAKAVKPSNASTKEKSPVAVDVSISYADPDKFVEEILEKTTSIVLSEVKEVNIDKHQEQLLDSIKKQLGLELKNIATIFKNTAYTEGFRAGIHHQPKRM
ncbi:Proline--tRNA ligase [Handroanthus impetiginosus]|uniref:Proline--tRNA ligase n=1 Tax=Handroanthus impetiginosus TaxID=429701 RepID=A0A2G9H1I8_9LAMI|nr:Proline--tRNA ligase [Handroanthus impetiginosus]